MDIMPFKSDSGNTYFHSKNINQFLITHPLLHYFLGLTNKGIDVVQWAKKLDTELFEIEGVASFTKKEVEYYIQKYILLYENGYLNSLNIPEVINGKLTATAVKSVLANTGQITFEVTEACNLNCEYCGYGKFYKDFKGVRTNQNLKFSVAVKLLDYLVEMWNSSSNVSHQKILNMSFYGGEPLVNFPLIKKMIDYSKKINLLHNRFEYGMTTNGVLLGKYMDFIVENNFLLLVSLDGDEENNGYRVYHDGNSSYQTILSNVRQLKSRYPDYFEKKVSFSVVLHNKNSVSAVHRFFKEEFNKIPNIAEISAEGIAPEFKGEFWKTYKNFRESLAQSDNYSVLEMDMFDKLPEYRDTFKMIGQYSGFSYNKLSDLIIPKTPKNMIPTATCLPMGKKVFLTAKGKILPCERISHDYTLGYVDEKQVHLDFEEIAQKYNAYYDKIRKFCNTCYITKNCNQCIFSLDIKGDNPFCYGHMNSQKFSAYLSKNMGLLEKKPEIYNKFIKEVVFI